MRDADLRFECFNLIMTSSCTDQQEDRLREILRVPCCKEPWFLQKLEKSNFFEFEEYLGRDNNDETPG